MATAPVEYQSALIESLRAASPGFTSNNPGVTLMDNPANSNTVINFRRTPFQPYLPPGPVVGPPQPPPPSTPVIGPEPGGGPVGPPVVGPGPVVGPVSPSLPPDAVPSDPAPAPSVPDYTDDLWPPVEPEPQLPPDPIAEPIPVPDPAPPDVRDLPPLDEHEDVATPVPVPDPSPWEPVDLPPLPPEPDPVDPPQGEIDVLPPGDSQPARDAIDGIGDITEVGEPLDEWDWLEPDIPEIPLPEIPEFFEPGLMEFNLSDADLLDLFFGDFGTVGGGGGRGWNPNVIMSE